jgi:hypothetical protein
MTDLSGAQADEPGIYVSLAETEQELRDGAKLYAGPSMTGRTADVDLSPRQAFFTTVGCGRGSSPRQTSPGRAVLRNLRRGGFQGTIGLVNPRYDEITFLDKPMSLAR